jgi:hypothetical protein
VITERLRVMAVGVALAGCGAPAATNSPAQSTPTFAGKLWLSSDAAAAAGTLLVFLPNGTLLMDSCGETYRLARWQPIDDRHIAWQEDTARIEAEITDLSDERLQLRLRLVNEFKEQSYRLATVPFVCPDLPK